VFKLTSLFVLQVLLLIGCNGNKKSPEWVRFLNENDYKMVTAEKYPYTNCQMDTVPTKIMRIKKEIEKSLIPNDKQVLPNKIVSHFFPDETEKCNFKYTHTAIAKDRNEFIINFLSPFTIRETYVGYLLQFLVKDNKIVGIYLFKVPNY
jgi:hypothetical protein